MQGGEDGGSGKDYAAMFNGFFKSARLASTYKPVLAAALVDVSEGGAGGGRQAWKRWTRREGDAIRVDLNLVAALFAKFYWDVTAGMDPRHTPPRMADPDNPGEDIVIVRLIKEEVEKRKRRRACRDMIDADEDIAGAFGRVGDRGRRALAGDDPPTLEELASDEMAGFRKRVIDEAIKPEALVHLPTDMDIYEACSGEDGIMLDAEAAAHMARNAVTIRTALSHMITRHLEDYNPSARHLATMVDLNAEYGAKIGRVRKQEASVAPTQDDSSRHHTVSRDDISPIYTMSLDLAAGLAKLMARPRAG